MKLATLCVWAPARLGSRVWLTVVYVLQVHGPLPGLMEDCAHLSLFSLRLTVNQAYIDLHKGRNDSFSSCGSALVGGELARQRIMVARRGS